MTTLQGERTLRVKLLAGGLPQGDLGEQVDVPADEALRLIASRFAVPAVEPVAETTVAVAPAKEERITKPKAKRRKGK